jgi:hypothetical protein
MWKSLVEDFQLLMRLTMDRPPWLGTIRDGVVNNNIPSA